MVGLGGAPETCVSAPPQKRHSLPAGGGACVQSCRWRLAQLKQWHQMHSNAFAQGRPRRAKQTRFVREK
jgi:hypothetical protein